MVEFVELHQGKVPLYTIPLFAVQVPFRRVTLQEANGHFDLYDTSGPQVRHLHAAHASGVSAWQDLGAVASAGGGGGGGGWRWSVGEKGLLQLSRLAVTHDMCKPQLLQGKT